MVNIGIPKNYTTSPSSFSHTPSLTINHEVALDLDSSNAFEGPEKLLEVWFSPSPDALQGCSEPMGLKAVPAEVWKTMLDLVNCKVLSIIESEDVDAYLLSESSMFVFPHKLILKTCGTTTLLCGLPRILEIAVLFGGFAQATAPPSNGISVAAAPYRVFYSRKNYLFPDRQHGPHRSWRNEVQTLDKLFVGGSAYMIGKMNGEHWYLYLTEPYTMLTPPASPRSMDSPGTETKILDLPTSFVVDRGSKVCEGEDETLEILMTDLDEENAQQFYLDHASAVAEDQWRGSQRGRDDHVDVFSNASDDDTDISIKEEAYPSELTTEGHALGTVVSDSCGLSNVYPADKYPDARVDAYLFTPCGFSANGVIPAPDGGRGTHYFTVHVTPEPICSYASFETNVPCGQKGRETTDIIQNVVDIFKPGRFSVTLFEATSSYEEKLCADHDELAQIRFLERQAARRNTKMDSIKGYRRVDRIVHDLDGYDLVFRYYERHDWKGGAPRIGESGM
ncbi:adenosylmethionine decarboxylase [Cladophialophora yegresii CBS 114405]|uniref:adenosylmethionine decarboxylase n=1 Tax=Cladophialophora yegresii CBS 114405 TaxID=1182544 RepID=W9VXJ7_9EURO|nr:adenosylmethionine decarboxylase [Cladophialophora yegresii CBS 114405]EXJ60567.1 adenosylmethionine decarboxylase [Cladophialophora yegresii CBS 114405]